MCGALCALYVMLASADFVVVVFVCILRPLEVRLSARFTDCIDPSICHCSQRMAHGKLQMTSIVTIDASHALYSILSCLSTSFFLCVFFSLFDVVDRIYLYSIFCIAYTYILLLYSWLLEGRRKTKEDQPKSDNENLSTICWLIVKQKYILWWP